MIRSKKWGPSIRCKWTPLSESGDQTPRTPGSPRVHVTSFNFLLVDLKKYLIIIITIIHRRADFEGF